MSTWLVRIAVLLVVGTAVGGVLVAARDVSRLRSVDASIAEQERIKQEVADGRKKLSDDISEARKEVAEIPDSLRAERTSRALDASFNLEKAQSVLDQKEVRATRRLIALRIRREGLTNRLGRWVRMFGGAEIVLVGALVVLRRRARPKG